MDRPSVQSVFDLPAQLGRVQRFLGDLNPIGTGLRPQHFQCLRQLVGLEQENIRGRPAVEVIHAHHDSVRAPGSVKRAGQHRPGSGRIAQAPAFVGGDRLIQLARPPGPGKTSLDEPVGGRRGGLAHLVGGNRADRQQHRHRLGTGPGLELGDELTDQRLVELFTGHCPDRHEHRARDLRLQWVGGRDQIRGTGEHLIDQLTRVEVLTGTSGAVTGVGCAEQVERDRLPGRLRGLVLVLAFPAAAHRAHPPSLPTPAMDLTHPRWVSARRSGAIGYPAQPDVPAARGDREPAGFARSVGVGEVRRSGRRGNWRPPRDTGESVADASQDVGSVLADGVDVITDVQAVLGGLFAREPTEIFCWVLTGRSPRSLMLLDMLGCHVPEISPRGAQRVGQPLSGQQHDPRPRGQPRPDRTRPGQRLLPRTITLTQHHRRSNRHGSLSGTANRKQTYDTRH